MTSEMPKRVVITSGVMECIVMKSVVIANVERESVVVESI